MAPQLFAWQAWHLATSTSTLRGRRGTFGTGLALVARLGTLAAATVCRPGVALGDIDVHSAWRGTYGTGLALVAPLGTLVAAAVCVAGVALGDIDRHFAWQAWHLATSTCILRGRRGTSVTGLGVVARLGTLVAAAVCMPGVALGDIGCGRPGT